MTQNIYIIRDSKEFNWMIVPHKVSTVKVRFFLIPYKGSYTFKLLYFFYSIHIGERESDVRGECCTGPRRGSWMDPLPNRCRPIDTATTCRRSRSFIRVCLGHSSRGQRQRSLGASLVLFSPLLFFIIKLLEMVVKESKRFVFLIWWLKFYQHLINLFD